MQVLYHEVAKGTFKAAKQCAVQQLNACPTEVTQQFINWSWCFVAVYYRMCLTGKAAEWAVKQQKQQVSWRAMMSIEAVLVN